MRDRTMFKSRGRFSIQALTGSWESRQMAPVRRRRAALSVEELEARLARATLVAAMTLTYQDADTDEVTVRLSRPLLTAANIDSVFTFDTGPVAGNGTPQQLRTIDLTSLAAEGVSLAITATPGFGDGVVNVGYINATGLDLRDVSVAGDLGKIDSGDPLGHHVPIAEVVAGFLSRFDDNGDGQVTYRLLGRLLGPEAASQQEARLLAMLDLDRNGAVNRQEATDFFRRRVDSDGN